MSAKLIEKLEWQILLKYLADFCQTEEGKSRSFELRPNLKRDAVKARWDLVDPLLGLIRLGTLPAIGEIRPIYSVLKQLSIGQVLEGEQFTIILSLLQTTVRVSAFARDFSSTCSTLMLVQGRLHPLPELLRAISIAIDEAGAVRDDATPELARIRSQKRGLRKRIEDLLSSISKETEFAQYLQDDFITMREDRYVVPIKLDGRGRVPGTIIDTSASGQTLYIEPASIRAQNQNLKELDMSERIEVFRILRELSQAVARESEAIKENYAELIALDLLFAEAQLAYKLDAGPIKLSDKPLLNLKEAVHPFLRLGDSGRVVANDIEVHEGQNCLVISGPNAGGKTVILKTVAMVHMMVAAGLMPSVGAESEVYLFENMFIEMGDTQDLGAQLSTFSGHLMGLKPILQHAGPADLIFLDEICVGTEPHTGAALAQSMLEHLAERGAWVIATTHFDSLKILALNNPRFRSGAMGYREGYHPTYKLNVDLPGLSFGIEVAEQVGIPSLIIRRAHDLRGKEVSTFENAIAKLLQQAAQYEEKIEEADVKIRKAEEEKLRWAHEVELLKKRRHDLAEKVIEQYEEELLQLREKFESTLKSVKKSDDINPSKKELTETLGELKKGLTRLGKDHLVQEKQPGEAVVLDKLKKGDHVYVSRFKKMGKILRKGKTASEKIEVEIGSLKFKVSVQELRIVSRSEAAKPNKLLQYRKKPKETTVRTGETKARLLVIPTGTNSLDLRGLTVEDAMEKTWRFLDAAVMRGEYAVLLIHGHGTQTLKQAIRNALAKDSPYDIEFFPGSPQEGGDGVTVVYFQRESD